MTHILTHISGFSFQILNGGWKEARWEGDLRVIREIFENKYITLMHLFHNYTYKLALLMPKESLK